MQGVRLPKGLEFVIFDCDGVLVDSEALAIGVYETLFAELGVRSPPGFWAQAVGRKTSETLALIGDTFGREIMPELSAEIWPRMQAAFASELRPTPGVESFLEALQAPRCVASSSDLERIRYSLQVAGISRFFGRRLYSSQFVAKGKPAPDIFIYAAAEMGANVKAALVIEDSTAGVIAARAAGAKVIGFLGGGHVEAGHGELLREAGADAIAASWAEVANLLARPERVGL